MNAVRRRFFALGVEACRHGVTAASLAAHLEQALRVRPKTTFEATELNTADLALAVAVCAGHAGAWQELTADHEALMLHSAQAHLSEIDAYFVVRQLLAEVLEQSRAGAAGPHSLGRYAGLVTLRSWLLDRLLVRIYRRRSGAQAGVRVERGLDAVNRLRLGARFVRVDGMPVQQAARLVGLRERDVRRAATRRIDVGQLLREMPRLDRAESGGGQAT
ncbi:MAG: hypothetical protein ACF8NJ_10940 [Phycisphaerales bacterium JB038]